MIEPPSLSSGSAFCTVNTVPVTSTPKLIVEVLLGDVADPCAVANAAFANTTSRRRPRSATAA